MGQIIRRQSFEKRECEAQGRAHIGVGGWRNLVKARTIEAARQRGIDLGNAEAPEGRALRHRLELFGAALKTRNMALEHGETLAAFESERRGRRDAVRKHWPDPILAAGVTPGARLLAWSVKKAGISGKGSLITNESRCSYFVLKTDPSSRAFWGRKDRGGLAARIIKKPRHRIEIAQESQAALFPELDTRQRLARDEALFEAHIARLFELEALVRWEVAALVGPR